MITAKISAEERTVEIGGGPQTVGFELALIVRYAMDKAFALYGEDYVVKMMAFYARTVEAIGKKLLEEEDA